MKKYDYENDKTSEGLLQLERWYSYYKDFQKPEDNIYYLCGKMYKTKNLSEKEYFRNQIIIGGIHEIYSTIKQNKLYDIKGKTYDIEDILEETISKYTESVDNGVILYSQDLSDFIYNLTCSVIMSFKQSESEENEVSINNISINYEPIPSEIDYKKIALELLESIDERMENYRIYKTILKLSFGIEEFDKTSDKVIAKYLNITPKEVKIIREDLLDLLALRAYNSFGISKALNRFDKKNKKRSK